MSAYSTPVSIFSHYARIEMLTILQEQAYTVTELTDRIDLSMPEISRHLSKLSEHQFVEKSAITRKYEITQFGRTIMQLYAPLRFIFSQVDFFQEHNLSRLPEQLQLSINLLSEAEYVEGTGFVMLKMREIVERTENKFQVMVDQPFPFGKEGIHVEYILPQVFLDQNKGLKPDKSIKSASYSIHPSIPIALSIRDNKEALIHFSNSDDTIDYSTGFHFQEGSDISYVLKAWNYYWETGEQMTFEMAKDF